MKKKTTRTKRRRLAGSDLRVHALVLVSLLVALVVAAGLLTTPSSQQPGAAAPSPLLSPAPGEPLDLPEVDPGPEIPEAGEDALIVPDIGLAAPVIDIEMDMAGVLSPPADTDIVGWWQRSAEPGARLGQTVITGHTVHSGGGVMNRLGEMQAGDEVHVRDEGRVVDYRVTDVQTLSTAEVADYAVPLFGQDREEGRLVLVTCTDWVDGDYLSNIIVVADPIRS